MKNLFTQEEIILCTYLAMYGAKDGITIAHIEKIAGRSLASIELKIRNIVAILDEEGVRRHSDIPPLSGVKTDEEGRRTNWDWIEPLTKLSKAQLFVRCRVLK